jgi:hypothetical protein
MLYPLSYEGGSPTERTRAGRVECSARPRFGGHGQPMEATRRATANLVAS